MNGVIGGLSGKNFESNDLDLRPLIVDYTSNTHKFLRKKDIEIDYFIFTWEDALVDRYIKRYEPKAILSNEQIHFKMKPHLQTHEHNTRVQAHYSRWYGVKQVMNLCTTYANKFNIRYDLIINARLDLCFHRQLNLDNIQTNKFHISDVSNMKKFSWPSSNEMIDHIFASSMDNMIQFSNLYDRLDEYTSPGQCPNWNIISSHFLTAWHLRKLNLLNENTISKSFITTNKSCDYSTDYHIFRYENLTSDQLKQKVDEL